MNPETRESVSSRGNEGMPGERSQTQSKLDALRNTTDQQFVLEFRQLFEPFLRSSPAPLRDTTNVVARNGRIYFAMINADKTRTYYSVVRAALPDGTHRYNDQRSETHMPESEFSWAAYDKQAAATFRTQQQETVTPHGRIDTSSVRCQNGIVYYSTIGEDSVRRNWSVVAILLTDGTYEYSLVSQER